MPTIEISDDLHVLLRSLARSADETDAEVLQRVLSSMSEDRAAALKAYREAEQDITSTN